MTMLLAISGLVISVLAVAATYHIATKQGLFRHWDVLVTISDPVLRDLKHEQLLGTFDEFKIKNFTRPDRDYLYFFKMPTLLSFGIQQAKLPSVFFVPITVINKTKYPITDVSIDISIPAIFMPDPHLDFDKPVGIDVRRYIDDAREEGHIEYTLQMKAYDNQTLIEPIFIDSKNIQNNKLYENGWNS